MTVAFREDALVTILRRCLDWRAVAALAAICIGTAIFAPQALGVALPVLLVAACQLSMALMVVMLQRDAPDGASRPDRI